MYSVKMNFFDHEISSFETDKRISVQEPTYSLSLEGSGHFVCVAQIFTQLFLLNGKRVVESLLLPLTSLLERPFPLLLTYQT